MPTNHQGHSFKEPLRKPLFKHEFANVLLAMSLFSYSEAHSRHSKLLLHFKASPSRSAGIDLHAFIEADEVEVSIPVAVHQPPLKIRRCARGKSSEGIFFSWHLDQRCLLALFRASTLSPLHLKQSVEFHCWPTTDSTFCTTWPLQEHKNTRPNLFSAPPIAQSFSVSPVPCLRKKRPSGARIRSVNPSSSQSTAMGWEGTPTTLSCLGVPVLDVPSVVELLDVSVMISAYKSQINNERDLNLLSNIK